MCGECSTRDSTRLLKTTNNKQREEKKKKKKIVYSYRPCAALSSYRAVFNRLLFIRANTKRCCSPRGWICPFLFRAIFQKQVLAKKCLIKTGKNDCSTDFFFPRSVVCFYFFFLINDMSMVNSFVLPNR